MNKAISYIVALVLVALMVNWGMTADLPQVPPMPERFKDIKVAQPDSSVPKENTELLGEWDGAWKYLGGLSNPFSVGLSYGQEIRRAKVIIYEVSSDKIKFLYGWAESPHYTGKGGWRKVETDIREEGGKKRFSFISAWRTEFYSENGILKGSATGNWDIKMKRVK
jgi:hypothetical protein